MNTRDSVSSELSSIRLSVSHAVNRLVRDGYAMATVTYSNLKVLEQLRKETTARIQSPITKHLLRRHGDGEEDGWVNVRKMTFVGSNHATTAAQKIASKLFKPSIWVPSLYEFGNSIVPRVRLGGIALGVSTLVDWRPNL